MLSEHASTGFPITREEREVEAFSGKESGLPMWRMEKQ